LIVLFVEGDILDFLKRHCRGCGTVVAIAVALVVLLVILSTIMFEREKKAAQVRLAAEEKQRQEEAIKREEAKVDKIRKFALKETPSVWAAYQSLQSEVDVQDVKIKELSRVLMEFDRIPEQDEDFVRIRELRDDMIRTRDALWKRLEDAYLAARKFEAAPTSKGNEELLKKALEDGVAEADAAEKKFKEMRQSK
jgi:hypothetical protein